MIATNQTDGGYPMMTNTCQHEKFPCYNFEMTKFVANVAISIFASSIFLYASFFFSRDIGGYYMYGGTDQGYGIPFVFLSESVEYGTKEINLFLGFLDLALITVFVWLAWHAICSATQYRKGQQRKKE